MKRKNEETKATNNTGILENPTIEVLRVKEFKGEKNNIICDLKINGISIYGVRVIEGKNGDFLSFPQRKGSDGNYYSICYCRLSDAELKSTLEVIEKML